MLRQTLAALAALLLLSPGQSLKGHDTDRSSSVEGSSHEKSADSLFPGLKYRQWYITDGEKEVYQNRTDFQLGLLEDSSDVEETEEDQRKAEAVLNRMASFLESQKSIRCQIEYELNQQITMGAVGSVNPAFERFELAFAKPNLLKVVDSQPRDAEYRWEMGCDGKYLQRVVFGKVTVEEAAQTLPEMLRQDGATSGWAYYLDPREVFSMFETSALKERLAGWTLRHGGTREFGEVRADYVVLESPEDDDENTTYKRLHLFVASGECPVPLMMVRDGDLVYSKVMKLDDPSNRMRSRDTEWRFTNWEFNFPIDREEFKLSMPEQALVDTMGTSPPKQSLAVFVGSQLPDFNVVGQEGETISSESLLGAKPAVLLLWHDEGRFLEDWHQASAAERKYGSDKVQTFAIYIDVDSRDKKKSWQMIDSISSKKELAEAGVAVQPRIFIADDYRDRRLLQEARYATYGVCAVIDVAGRVINKYPGPSVRDFAKLSLDGIDAVLSGRDFVAEQLQAIANTKANQRRMKDEWNTKFESSWRAKD